MKILLIAVAALFLSGCLPPDKQARHFVSCALPDGREVRTQSLDVWVYEDGGWSGYSYRSETEIFIDRVAVYVPPQGSMCIVKGDLL